jgi:hypothetical protein
MKNKKTKSMLEVSKGYEAFIEGKKTTKASAAIFERAIKKASVPIKQRGSK